MAVAQLTIFPIRWTNKQCTGAVAGRNAKIEVDQLYQRERELNDGEARLSAKEMDLNGKLAIANRVEAVLATVTQVGF